MTIHMAVVIDTLRALSTDLRWCSYNIFYTQYHTVTVINHDESDAVFYWKGESLEENWEFILNAFI